jgi:2-haloacid dehalogenase
LCRNLRSGGAVIDWNPRYLYRKQFNGNETAMEKFLGAVCTLPWNAQQDAGQPFANGCGSLKRLHPDKAKLVDAWFERYEEMLGGEIPGTVDILRELRSRSVPICALSNWPAETFPIAVNRFECLSWFNGVLLSGQVKVLKPDPRIFEIFLNTFRIEPSRAIYIDDTSENFEMAVKLGLRAVMFRDPAGLRMELTRIGLLVHKIQGGLL